MSGVQGRIGAWRRRRLLAALAGGAASLALSGCGQKGPLYLPAEEQGPAKARKKDPNAALGRRAARA